MMRVFICLSVWLSLISVCFAGQGMYPVPMVYPALAGQVVVSDDFSGDLSAWTLQSGTISIVGGEIFLDNFGVLSHNTDLSNIKQWITWQQTGASAYAGAYFRFTGNTSDRAYAVRTQQNGVLAWRHCLGASCSDIETATVGTVTNGEYFGVEIEGTASATVCRVWRFGLSVPPVRGSWGVADFTFTNDPASAADVGTYVGLYTGSSADAYIDNFAAGGIE